MRVNDAQFDVVCDIQCNAYQTTDHPVTVIPLSYGTFEDRFRPTRTSSKVLYSPRELSSGLDGTVIDLIV